MTRTLPAILLMTALLLPACQDGGSLDGPPNLIESSEIRPLTWSEVNVAIPTYTIANSGGALSTCHTLISRPLPGGLRVSVSEDRRNCEITGSPQSLPADVNARQVIYAGNRFGIDSVTIAIGGDAGAP